MISDWPAVNYKEQSLREGMQIESADISIEEKVELLDTLGETGLDHIAVGSFVRPDYTPQMANIDELMEQFTPKPGVKYTALALNQIGVDRANEYSPPLTIESSRPSLKCHMCDVFVRRNANKSQQDEIDSWEQTVETAIENGATEAGIGVNAAWGSNFTGKFTEEERMEMLERQYDLWEDAGIPVTSVFLGDPMGWCMPHIVEHQLTTIQEKWPEITEFNIHLHNPRGMAVPSVYASLRALKPEHTLNLDGTIGGIGGCPYCGCGRATGMMPTEDVLHMLEEMGFDTGVDLDKLIDAVWLLEDILDRPDRESHTTYGHVSKAGPLPHDSEDWFDPNMPFVETFKEARHFRDGPEVYDGQRSPWDKEIKSPALPTKSP